MTARDDVHAFLERHGLATRKSLGQNFLIDGGVLDDVARTALMGEPSAIVEIGPGPGTLTRRLAASGATVVAVEKDPRVAPALVSDLADLPNVRIVHDDALSVRFASLTPGVRPAVAGNIPYNISSPLVLALIHQRAEIGDVTLMLQEEVADRLRARPDTREWGSLSVMLQLHAAVLPIRRVPPQCFLPRPKVWSSVVRFAWRSAPAAEVGDLVHFENVVRAAFAQRRKTLRNSLMTRFTKEAVEAAGAAAGIELRRRGETLSIPELARLAHALPAPERHS